MNLYGFFVVVGLVDVDGVDLYLCFYLGGVKLGEGCEEVFGDLENMIVEDDGLGVICVVLNVGESIVDWCRFGIEECVV